MLSNQTSLEQFRSFYKEHKPNNFEEAVEKFSIFGGINWGDIDTSKPSIELIEKVILPDFRYIRNDVTELTTGMPLYHSILTGVAQGDGKPHTAFKRANVTKEVGENALDEIIDTGIIKLEKSKKIFTSWAESEAISNKLYFTTPFLRFWFAFVSPIFKGIRDGDFKEIRDKFTNRENEFVQLTFTQLAHEVLKLSFVDDPILEISTYWDNNVDIDIYAKTKSGKIIAGTTKYTNAKIKKSELNRLKESCEKTGMKADIFVLFSKKGFSSELKSLKGENLKLFTVKNFKKLVE
ncbi:MAG: DUF234 domain-containing protein [Campylobacterota bacterium]|nr:DUF234 domain-containing protein [Campylobacterota bacterium]